MSNSNSRSFSQNNIKSSKHAQKAPIELKIGRAYILPIFIVLTFVVIMLWLKPAVVGDFFIALAGGRDALSGHLGTPDDWSFTTGSHVWINQNWGCDVIFYLIQRLAGDCGLLVLKMVQIAACALAAVLASRKKDVPISVSLLTAALVMSFLSQAFNLRPYITTLVIAPFVLWLLYLTKEKPKLIWLVSLVVVIWSDLHGGFIFGLGMMFLWAMCHIVEKVSNKDYNGILSCWHTWVAVVVTAFLVCFASPFGLSNLTSPLIMLKNNAWSSIAEWSPVWVAFDIRNFWGVMTIELISIVGFMAVLFIIKLLWESISRTKYSSKQHIEAQNDIGSILFDIIFTIVSVVMAVKSRRIIPLAMLMLIPVLAKQVWWVIETTCWRWILIAVGCITLVITFTSLNSSLKYYKSNYPFFNPGTFFERMNFMSNFPVELAKFINDNNLSGNVFCDWTWEGFLRLNCPQLKMFIGGRAQQVYDEETYIQYNDIFSSRSPQEVLASNNIHLIAIPNNAQMYAYIMRNIVEDGKWAIVFSNGDSFLLADSNWAPAKDIVGKALNNKLVYKAPATALMSLGDCMLSPVTAQDMAKGIDVLGESLKIKTSLWGYNKLVQILQEDPKFSEKLGESLQQELIRLEAMDIDTSLGSEILLSRISLSKGLFQYYSAKGMNEQAGKAEQSLQVAQQLYGIMQKAWR